MMKASDRQAEVFQQELDEDVRESLRETLKRSLQLSEDIFEVSENDVENQDSNHPDGNEAVKEVHAVAKKEIMGVHLWKCLFIFVVLATSAIVSSGTWIFLKAEEDDDYTESYENFVEAMRDAVDVHVEHIHLGFESMANSISSDAATSGATFPFYTMKNFEAEAEGIRKFSRAAMFAFCPYIEPQNILQWMNYSVTNQGWLDISRQWALRSGESSVSVSDFLPGGIAPAIYDLGGPGGTPQQASMAPPYAPVWMTSPPPFQAQTVNLDSNFFGFARAGNTLDILEEIREGFFTRILVPGETGALTGLLWKPEDHDAYVSGFVDWNRSALTSFQHPHAVFMQPVFLDALDSSSQIVGYFVTAILWDAYVTNLLPDGVEGPYCVIRNSCGQSLTYRLTGNRAFYIGAGDFHDESYESTERIIPFSRPRPDDYVPVEGQCIYSFHIYSSSEFEDIYRSNTAVLLTCLVASAFFFLILSYFMYDWFVRRRNSKVVRLAAKTSEIVSSLFPKQVRERLFAEQEEKQNGGKSDTFKNVTYHQDTANIPASRGLDFGDVTEHNQMDDEGFMYKSSPIADLYPETTILFADIAGFTSWSSSREPAQVFTLLETLYGAFDKIARRRRVFKVETIGDCYVAVAGLPEPQKDHAVNMCRFAKDCLHKMRELTQRLGTVLGPDTMELDMRFGLHSGSVTAGVLRGEKGRFQLFGDTMNTASRMESTGRKGMVQVSQETADLVAAAGKKHWLKPREDQVNAKGKGVLQTYWVTTRSSGSDAGLSTDDSDSNPLQRADNSDHLSSFGEGVDARLETDLTHSHVKWNTELLRGIFNKIARSRSGVPESARIDHHTESETKHGPAIDELREFVRFPPVETLLSDEGDPSEHDELEEFLELEEFISAVAEMHGEQAFHNFEHSSHVTMSVIKMLGELNTDPSASGNIMNPALVISMDPVAQLACVLAALVKDLSHTGVPNSVFVRENNELAQDYRGRCVVEQKSIDCIWELLMEEKFIDLRRAMYRTEEEKQRFRQVFIHCVLATDITDKSLSESRKMRWSKAFGIVSRTETLSRTDLQVTMLLELIIQASDLIHTMQHWDSYRKWSGRSFQECYQAHLEGRSEDDPSTSWLEGETLLFENTVLPLTQRLSDCRAFKKGTIDAYVDFAKSNRFQWSEEGESIVNELVAEVKADALT